MIPEFSRSSGFVVSRNGWAVTSAHSLLDQRLRLILVGLLDRGPCKDVIQYSGIATPLAVDTCLDIALVQLPPLPPGRHFDQVFDLYCNDETHTGESIFTCGHPSGAGYAMRFGNVSFLNRSMEEDGFESLNPNLAPDDDFYLLGSRLPGTTGFLRWPLH